MAPQSRAPSASPSSSASPNNSDTSLTRGYIRINPGHTSISAELGTRLSGRYIEIPIYPLSYLEFLEFHKLDDNHDSLNAFLRVGGLPGLRNFDINDTRQIRDYIQGVYNTIMMRDVMEREQIRNTNFLINLARYIADTSGKLVSTNNIAKTMCSQGEKVTSAITSAYLSYITNALIFTPVPRFDIHGKKLFEQNQKYYFTDHGISNYLYDFQIRKNIERIMETVVWNQLRIQDFKVTVGILRKGEIDFVAQRDEQTLYFQVTYLLGSQETIDREFGNLKAINDNHPKYVISMDPVSGEVEGYPGIHHIHLRQFLATKF